MMPAQFQIDLFEELRTLIGGFEPIVLRQVMDELYGLSRQKGHTGSAARLGLMLGRTCLIADGSDLKTGSVDEQLIEYASRNNCLVLTNDRGIRDVLFTRGIGVISMRNQKKLELLRR